MSDHIPLFEFPKPTLEEVATISRHEILSPEAIADLKSRFPEELLPEPTQVASSSGSSTLPPRESLLPPRDVRLQCHVSGEDAEESLKQLKESMDAHTAANLPEALPEDAVRRFGNIRSYKDNDCGAGTSHIRFNQPLKEGLFPIRYKNLYATESPLVDAFRGDKRVDTRQAYFKMIWEREVDSIIAISKYEYGKSEEYIRSSVQAQAAISSPIKGGYVNDCGAPISSSSSERAKPGYVNGLDSCRPSPVTVPFLTYTVENPITYDQGSGLSVTTFILRKAGEEKTRKITHCYYTGWPDKGVISVPELADLVILALGHLRAHNTVIHCSAGVGRTGTLIGAMLFAMNLPGHQTVHEIAMFLRGERPGMIQTLEQLGLLNIFIAEHSRLPNESIAEHSELIESVAEHD